MAVILTILKILLWIVLIILGIILLLVLLVLFAPIRYRLQGEINSEKIEISAKVSFLIISVLVNFSKAAGLDYMARLLGIKVYPRGSDGKKNKPSHSKKSKEKKAKGKKTEGSEISDSEFWNDVIAEPESVEADGETDEALPDEALPDEAAEKKPKVSLKEKAAKAYDKAGQIKEKTGQALEKAQNSLDKVQTKLDHVIQFLDKPFTQKTIKRVKKLIVRIFKTIKPKKSRANVRFGLSNAADTGEMLGKLSAFYPYYYK